MIYLDNAASVLPDRETADFFRDALIKYGANQEAAHKAGYQLRKEISLAGERLSRALTGSADYSVIWCGSATEAFHIFSHCSGSGRKVISSALEHPALSAALNRCAVSGELHLLRPDSTTGQLKPPAGPIACDIAAFHLVQSETGIIQDTEKLFSHFPDAVHFLDAVQGAGKLNIPCRQAHVIAVSGNKFGVPGIAALLIAPHWKGAEKFCQNAEKMRSEEYLVGRVQPSAVLTCAFAAGRFSFQIDDSREKITRLNQFLRKACPALGLVPTIPEEYASPYILHLTAKGCQGGVLVRMLSEEGILLSSGSACASETREPSKALTALGFSRQDAYAGLRISFDRSSTEEDVKILLSSLEKVLKKY